MLDKAGYKVNPVLVSTRDHGFVREAIPVSSQFNYVICLVELDNKPLLLDATEKLLPIGWLPERALNGRGFVVGKDGYTWTQLFAPKSKTVVFTDLKLQADGQLGGQLKFDRMGYDALAHRKMLLKKGESEYVKELNSSQQFNFKASEFKNTKTLHEAFSEVHEIDLPNHVTSAGQVLYINPFIHSQIEENPFKTEKREYPVDFGYPFDKTYIFRLTIPEGYAVDELPKTKVFVLPENASKFSYNVSSTGNVISIACSLQVNKSLFSQLEYSNLREFYNHIVAKEAEQIVLKKL